MPPARRLPPSPATSPAHLATALKAAPDAGAVWALITAWRKRQADLVDAVAQHTPHWDAGLVMFVCAVGYGTATTHALANPTLPAWAEDQMLQWAVGRLMSEASGEALARAARVISGLRERGVLTGTHLVIGDLAATLDGRPAMAARQIETARALLAFPDLPQTVYDHIASVAMRGKIPLRSQEGRGRYDELALMSALLRSSQSTDAWVQRMRDSLPTTPYAAVSWNHLLDGCARWRDVAAVHLTPTPTPTPAAVPPRR